MMNTLSKIDETTNVLTWFEIPVSDIDRAQKFYETILDITMVKKFDGPNEAVFFPYNPEVVQATSGRVTGVLTKTEENKPSPNGTVVYINASPRIQAVLVSVKQAGGKVLMAEVKIKPGYIASIRDSEGNTVGLHAER